MYLFGSSVNKKLNIYRGDYGWPA
jgi:hypothetical protein